MLREQTGVRISGGEMARDVRSSCAARSAADALDVVQPDVVLSLGICGARTLAELALRANRWFTPHTWTNGIGLLANLHVCCGVGGGPFLEFPYDPPGWTPERRDFMLAEPIEVDADGLRCTCRDAPGLGIELDEEADQPLRGAAMTEPALRTEAFIDGRFVRRRRRAHVRHASPRATAACSPQVARGDARGHRPRGRARRAGRSTAATGRYADPAQRGRVLSAWRS